MTTPDQRPEKAHISFADQASKLSSQGLSVHDMGDFEKFLTHANYYRFSGYTQYFRTNAESETKVFRDSVSFSHIREIYELDQQLRNLSLRGLTQVESVLRTQFAHIFSRDVSPYQKYLDEDTYQHSNAQGYVSESILKDLDRSKEPYVFHFRVENPLDRKLPPTYPKMPIWAAVESMSFGTLSKCLERCVDQEITKRVADSVGVTRQGFATQIKAFVYLRNRSAHHSRLWHHSVIDAPPIANNILQRAKREHGQFDSRSIFHILVAVDNFLNKSGLDSSFMDQAAGMLSRNGDFNEGIKKPMRALNKQAKN